MDSCRIGKVAPLFFISAVCLFGFSAFASFGLGISIEDGAPIFSSSAIIGDQPYYRYGHVEYEVYAPEGYTGTLAAVPDDHYVYAYRVFNSAVSNLSIDAFIVSLAPGLAVENSGNEGTGVDPSGGRSVTGSITYYFDEVISPGENSSILLFSSLFGPAYGVANISGEVCNSTVEMVMVPVPEPVSCLLFGIGGICLLKRRRAS